MAFFDDSQNPFADPSVRNATQSAVPATIDFNPFEKPATTAGKAQPSFPATPEISWPPASGSQPSPSSVMKEEAPPAYAASPAVRVTTEELERRQRELEVKAAEIQRREDELARQSVSMAASGNNWPPLPRFCPLQPCYHQDIDVDIPTQFNMLVRMGYYTSLGHMIVYALNTIIGFAFFMVTITTQQCLNNATCGSAGTTFGLSLLWLLLFSPGSYACWFRPLYKAFKNDSSISFFWFFVSSLGQFIVDIVWALGFPGAGSLGFINGLSMMPINPGIATTMVVVGCLSAALAIAVALLGIRVHRVYRTTGASFEKAKQELARGAFSSDVMRTAVAAGVQSAVTSPSQSQAPSTSGSNRF